jgi:hypothetical protein
MPANPLPVYRAAIARELAQGDATEHTHRPALKTLVEALATGVTATNEPKHVECGAPDYKVSRNTPHGPLTIGHIEAKDVGAPLALVEKSDQLKRYRKGLPNLILTDYIEFRWYVGGERRIVARLGSTNGNRGVILEKGGLEAVEGLLRAFLDHKAQPISKPKELAERLARLTHLIRDVIVQAFQNKTASPTLRDLHEAFAEVLIPDLSAEAFADMFSQTIAYGLFAARVNHNGPARFRRQDAAALIPKTNPFLRKLFASITGPDLDDEPFVGFVDDLAQLLADTDMGAVLAEFGKRTKREDPIVHFYETFLAAYDPKLRKSRGVYYTPEPVVSYIVRSVDYLLRTRFNCTNGLADTGTVSINRVGEDGNERTETLPRVLVLDPACGTGTFLYAIVDLIREQFMKQDNAGRWPPYVRENLLKRLFGFELLMAPYAVAHLKLGMQLAGQDLPAAQRGEWGCELSGDDRLGVYLTNTLEEALKKSELLMGGWVSDEANAAAEIKRDLPIMVVLGNPPYANFGRMNKGKWITGLLKDYKKDLHEKKLNLDDDYIKFIRFAQWRIERTGAGILAFITNHSYIDGITHRRMRESLAETFDEIYVLDLHGNAVRPETPPTDTSNENVFDIKQGVAIAIFVRLPGQTGLATRWPRPLFVGTSPSQHSTSTPSSPSTSTQRLKERLTLRLRCSLPLPGPRARAPAAPTWSPGSSRRRQGALASPSFPMARDTCARPSARRISFTTSTAFSTRPRTAPATPSSSRRTSRASRLPPISTSSGRWWRRGESLPPSICWSRPHWPSGSRAILFPARTSLTPASRATSDRASRARRTASRLRQGASTSTTATRRRASAPSTSRAFPAMCGSSGSAATNPARSG